MNTVTVSVKSQAVIPKEVRARLGIEAGQKFLVDSSGWLEDMFFIEHRVMLDIQRPEPHPFASLSQNSALSSKGSWDTMHFIRSRPLLN